MSSLSCRVGRRSCECNSIGLSNINLNSVETAISVTNIEDMLTCFAIVVTRGLVEVNLTSRSYLVSSTNCSRDIRVVERPVIGSSATRYRERELTISATIAGHILCNLGRDIKRSGRSADSELRSVCAAPVTVTNNDSVEASRETSLNILVLLESTTSARPSITVVARAIEDIDRDNAILLLEARDVRLLTLDSKTIFRYKAYTDIVGHAITIISSLAVAVNVARLSILNTIIEDTRSETRACSNALSRVDLAVLRVVLRNSSLLVG